MQGLILAAGAGRRLGEITRDRTKAMIEVAGRRLIERALDSLVKVGVTRVVLVVGYHGESLREFVGEEYGGVPIHYVRNPEYATTNNIYSLYLAREEFGSDDTLLLEADVVFDHSILECLATDPRETIAAVAPFHSGLDGTVVTVTELGNVEAFIPKQFQELDRADYLKTINLYKFSAGYIRSTYLPFLDAYVAVVGKNAYYEEVLSILTGPALPQLGALIVTDHRWYEIDTREDLANANTIFADPADRFEAYASRYGGLWRFPDVRDHALLVNPYFPTPALTRQLERSMSTVMRMYPSTQSVQRQLAARLVGVTPGEIVVGNGASELIAAFAANSGDAVIGVPVPAFEEYRSRFGPGRVVDVRSSTGHPYLSADELIDALPTVDVLVVVNPHNPSGACLTEAELSLLIGAAARLGKRIVLDESFVDFAEPGVCPSWLDSRRLRDNPHVVVVKSLGKSHGLPGLRLGFLATADAELLANIERALPIWNISSPAEVLLTALPGFEADYQRSLSSIRRERARMVTALNTIPGIECLPSQANFVLFRLTGDASPDELASRLLLDADVLVKPLSNKVGMESGRYVRLAVLDEDANDHVVRAIARAVENLEGQSR